MGSLEKEIAAYEKMLPELLEHHSGKFVIIRDEKLAGAFDTFDTAAETALKRFGRGPYLIRQVGVNPATIPASVAYRVVHASH